MTSQIRSKPIFHLHDCESFVRVIQFDTNKWKVTCIYEDCPKGAHPVSGKTREIAVKKWNDREMK